MLNFNLHRIFALRGIDSPTEFLTQNGFSPADADLLLGREHRTIQIGDVERLCVLLHCTPNELFEWHFDVFPAIAANHPLNDLNNHPTASNLARKIREIPIQKLAELEAKINELRITPIDN